MISHSSPFAHQTHMLNLPPLSNREGFTVTHTHTPAHSHTLEKPGQNETIRVSRFTLTTDAVSWPPSQQHLRWWSFGRGTGDRRLIFPSFHQFCTVCPNRSLTRIYSFILATHSAPPPPRCHRAVKSDLLMKVSEKQLRALNSEKYSSEREIQREGPTLEAWQCNHEEKNDYEFI